MRRKSGLIRNFHDSPSFSPQLSVLPSPLIDFLSSPCQSPLSVRRCRRCCSVVVVVVVAASVVVSVSVCSSFHCLASDVQAGTARAFQAPQVGGGLGSPQGILESRPDPREPSGLLQGSHDGGGDVQGR